MRHCAVHHYRVVLPQGLPDPTTPLRVAPAAHRHGTPENLRPNFDVSRNYSWSFGNRIGDEADWGIFVWRDRRLRPVSKQELQRASATAR